MEKPEIEIICPGCGGCKSVELTGEENNKLKFHCETCKKDQEISVEEYLKMLEDISKNEKTFSQIVQISDNEISNIRAKMQKFKDSENDILTTKNSLISKLEEEISKINKSYDDFKQKKEKQFNFLENLLKNYESNKENIFLASVLRINSVKNYSFPTIKSKEEIQSIEKEIQNFYSAAEKVMEANDEKVIKLPKPGSHIENSIDEKGMIDINKLLEVSYFNEFDKFFGTGLKWQGKILAKNHYDRDDHYFIYDPVAKKTITNELIVINNPQRMLNLPNEDILFLRGSFYIFGVEGNQLIFRKKVELGKKIIEDCCFHNGNLLCLTREEKEGFIEKINLDIENKYENVQSISKIPLHLTYPQSFTTFNNKQTLMIDTIHEFFFINSDTFEQIGVITDYYEHTIKMSEDVVYGDKSFYYITPKGLEIIAKCPIKGLNNVVRVSENQSFGLTSKGNIIDFRYDKDQPKEKKITIVGERNIAGTYSYKSYDYDSDWPDRDRNETIKTAQIELKSGMICKEEKLLCIKSNIGNHLYKY